VDYVAVEVSNQISGRGEKGDGDEGKVGHKSGKGYHYPCIEGRCHVGDEVQGEWRGGSVKRKSGRTEAKKGGLGGSKGEGKRGRFGISERVVERTTVG